MKRILILVCLISFNLEAFSQICGTSQEAQMQMAEIVKKNRNQWLSYTDAPEAPVYIPVKFHRVGLRDGTGKVSVIDILEQLCVLNNFYATQDFHFYLKGGIEEGIKDIFNDAIYQDASAGSAPATLRSVSDRNRDAINIFVPLNPRTGTGGIIVQGFYNPQGDYCVIRKSQVESATSTIAHEIGHFFGLPHTFLGWESQEYDCSKPTPEFVGGFLVEHVDRLKMRNGSRACTQAADGFCDTQAEYNLGIGFNGCTYNGCAKDPDGESLDPDEDNLMSYFSDACVTRFTGEQSAFMTFNYNSSERDYIRSNYVPDLNEISRGTITQLLPERNSTTQYYNRITFEWEPVENATQYVLEVELFGSSGEPVITEVVSGTSFQATNLEAGKRYNWSVFPAGELDVCGGRSSVWRFLTSRTPVSTVDQVLQNSIMLTSNPVAKGQEFNCLYQAPYTGLLKVQVTSLHGSVHHAIETPISDHTTVGIPAIETSGIYLIQFDIDGKKAIKKVVVQ